MIPKHQRIVISSKKALSGVYVKLQTAQRTRGRTTPGIVLMLLIDKTLDKTNIIKTNAS